MATHPHAATGFGKASNAYHRGRPEYPARIAEWMHQELSLPPRSHLLELGAGTGKFTKTLLAGQFNISAVEPVATMREKLIELYPAVTVLDGSAEAIDAPAESADAVVAAQAFHWFGSAATLQECARVLKPHGALVLLWNIRDNSVDWVREFDRIIDAYEGETPRFKQGRWRQAFTETRLFTPLRRVMFPHIQTATKETLVDRALSTSFIATLPEPEQERVSARIHALTEHHPALQGNTPFALPYRTEIYWCRKI